MRPDPRALGAVLFIASALISAALVAQVDGFALSPVARFALTVLQPGIAAALLFVPPPGRRRGLPPRG